MSYEAFFRKLTGFDPYVYQRAVADRDRLPSLIEAPTGVGKTEAVLIPPVFRALAHPDPEVRAAAPKRVFYALPMRTLVNQTVERVSRWISRAGLQDDVDVVTLMGGADLDLRTWRSKPDAFQIIIGTIDMLASKALVRAYGAPRSIYPIDAGLIWNDTHIIVDEVQLAPRSTTTFRQVEAFRRDSAFGATGLTCMSATIPHELIDTVDNPYPSENDIVRVTADDDPLIADRLSARRTIRRLPYDKGKWASIAKEAVERHRPGSITLVMLNSVKSAQDVYKALKRVNKSAVPAVLLHSRFRPVDRDAAVAQLDDVPEAGLIVVSTQVLEAGVDINAFILIVESAPWPSLVQRAGRCNREGNFTDAEIWWVPSAVNPYAKSDIESTEKALGELEGQSVTSTDLLAQTVAVEPLDTLVLRRIDFDSLFDTAPDLSGHDIDVAPYIRDSDDLDASLCWLSWPQDNGAPPADLDLPSSRWHCATPLGAVRELIANDVTVWRVSTSDGLWARVTNSQPARPGELLVVNAAKAGYTEELGLDPRSSASVTVSPTDNAADSTSPASDSRTEDPETFSGVWVQLEQHLNETAAEAQKLVEHAPISEEIGNDVVLAAHLHDIGKSHNVWQAALCATATDDDVSLVESGGPWAKSANSRSRLKYPDGITGFRHELASVAMLPVDSPLLVGANDRDLVRYLVLAHHGKLRVQARSNDDKSVAGVRDGDEVAIPCIGSIEAHSVQINLQEFGVGAETDRSWADCIAALLKRYGPFQLAYLETLVRIADWRASALPHTAPENDNA